MKTISVSNEGVTPLLIHRFTDEAQISAPSGTRFSIATDSESPHEQAEQSLYCDENGVSGIPQPNMARQGMEEFVPLSGRFQNPAPVRGGRCAAPTCPHREIRTPPVDCRDRLRSRPFL